MGFNIAGIVIDKSLKNKVKKISESFDWEMELEGEVTFEEAMENWKEPGYCDIYFTDKGTLIFVDMETIQGDFKMADANVLSFAISETSMAFYFNLYEGDKLRRKIMDLDGEIVSEYGEKLEMEEKYEDTEELIWAMIEKMLGKSFFKIEPDEIAYRYLLLND